METNDRVGKKFMETIVEVIHKIKKLLKTYTKMIIIKEEQQLHVKTKNRNLCKSKFSVKNHKIIDHRFLIYKRTPIFKMKYSDDLQYWKQNLFVIDYGITAVRTGIALNPLNVAGRLRNII